MRILLTVLVIVPVAGCEATPPDYHGTEMVPYFPFDGQRTWEFISSDETVSYSQIAQMRSLEPDVIDGVRVYPIDHTVDCRGADPDCVEGDFVRSISWSSDEIQGVAIYSWTEGTAAPITFDPPLLVADREMKNGDTVVTETAGAVWTSTLIELGDCPTRFSADIGQCAHFSLDDGDDNPQTGVGLVGDYWAAVGFSFVGIQLVGDPGIWELQHLMCEPEEECDGTW